MALNSRVEFQQGYSACSYLSFFSVWWGSKVPGGAGTRPCSDQLPLPQLSHLTGRTSGTSAHAAQEGAGRVSRCRTGDHVSIAETLRRTMHGALNRVHQDQQKPPLWLLCRAQGQQGHEDSDFQLGF